MNQQRAQGGDGYGGKPHPGFGWLEQVGAFVCVRVVTVTLCVRDC